MDYRYLLHITYTLITAPKKAWSEIVGKGAQTALPLFVFPMIALSALAAFLGCLFRVGIGGAEQYEYAMRECCGLAVALFAGFYLSSYLTNLAAQKFFRDPDSPARAEVLCGYGLVVVFVLDILTSLAPDLGMIALLMDFYTVYIIWEGVPFMYASARDDGSRLRLTLIVSALLLVAPYVIQKVFSYLSLVLD